MFGLPWLTGISQLILTTTPNSVNLTLGAHYPPNATAINDLSFAINGTGAPGIYNSSYTPDDLYGTYNWCNMPHVRAKEYALPPSSYTLIHLTVLQRHHKRTPYSSNIFPQESIPWSCSLKPFVYGGTSPRGAGTVPVAWAGARDAANPFAGVGGEGFGGSNCLFPQITAAGLQDSYTHGADLRAVYHDLLHFLPSDLDPSVISFRVTNNIITSQVLGGLVHGLFPTAGEVDAYIQAAEFDSLEPTYPCPAAVAIRANYTDTDPAWMDHLKESKGLFGKLDGMSGVAEADEGWHGSWDHYYDNLSAKQCHGKALPCSINDSSICVTQAEADTVYRLGNYEYSYLYRDAPHSTTYSALRYGAFFLELKSHLQAAMTGKSPIKYRHNVAHDGSISLVLGFLQVEEMVWPGMGAEVIFELWKKARAFHVRVLWGGQPMRTSTPMGRLDMVPVQRLISYIDTYVPSDLVVACNRTWRTE